VAAKRRQYMLMAEILRPSLVLLRRSTPSSAKKRQRLPEAVGVEVWQPDRHECLFEHDTDRTGAAPVLAVQSGHFEPKGALRGWRLLRDVFVADSSAPLLRIISAPEGQRFGHGESDSDCGSAPGSPCK